MPVLNFEQTNSAPYPVADAGVGGAITVCLAFNDPMVAFLTQTPNDDEVVYLSLGLDNEYRRHVTPAGRVVISGMGYNPITRKIWCSSTTTQMDEVFSFDPETGLEIAALNLAADSPTTYSHGLGTNGFMFVRSAGNLLELRTMGGFKIGEKNFSGRQIRGATASPFSWTFGDANTDEIVVVGAFGNELATATAPGASGGLMAIAYDYVTDHSAMPQIIPPDGIIGPPGSNTHPDTPWNPAPWAGRHRLYIANETDQMIYAGYLTAGP